MNEKCAKSKHVAKGFVVLALLLVFSVLFPVQKASAKTGEYGVVISNGVIGNYKITTHRGANKAALYVTNQKTNKKVKVVEGTLGTGVAVAGDKIYYTLDRTLYEFSAAGKTDAKAIDQEIKSNNDSGMNILACKESYLYYCKPVDAQFRKLNVYRYNIASGKKTVCLTDTFTYGFSMDVYKNYKYSYNKPTEIGSGYVLQCSKVTSNKKSVIAKNVYSHTFSKNNIYFTTVNEKTGKVTYYKAGLNGKKKKALASFNYLTLAKKNQKTFDAAFYGPLSMTNKKAKFEVYISKGDSNKTYFYTIDFKSGKIKVVS